MAKKTLLIQTDDPNWTRNSESAQKNGWAIKEVPPADDRASALNNASEDGWNLWVKSGEIVSTYPDVFGLPPGIYSVSLYDGEKQFQETRLWFGRGTVSNPVFESVIGDYPLRESLIFCKPMSLDDIKSRLPRVERWVRDRPADRMANYYLAVCLLAVNRSQFISQAHKFLHIFGRHDQESDFIRFHLASCHAERREFNKSIQCLVGVLAGDIRNKSAWEGLAEIMMQSGLRSRAIAMLRNADVLGNQRALDG